MATNERDVSQLLKQLEAVFRIGDRVVDVVNGKFELHKVVAHIKSTFVSTGDLWTGIATVPVHPVDRELTFQEERGVIMNGDIPDSGKYQRHFFKRTPLESMNVSRTPCVLENIKTHRCGEINFVFIGEDYFSYYLEKHPVQDPTPGITEVEKYSGVHWKDEKATGVTPEFLDSFWDHWSPPEAFPVSREFTNT